MRQKLKKNGGETLIEVLASILIGALSVALLFSAVLASTRMDRGAEETDKAFRANLIAAEKQTEPLIDGPIGTGSAKVIVIHKNPETLKAELPVVFYGGEGAVSYSLPLPAEEGGGGS